MDGQSKQATSESYRVKCYFTFYTYICTSNFYPYSSVKPTLNKEAWSQLPSQIELQLVKENK